MSRMVQYCDKCLRVIEGRGAFNLEAGTAYHIGCAPSSFRAEPGRRPVPLTPVPMHRSLLNARRDILAAAGTGGPETPASIEFARKVDAFAEMVRQSTRTVVLAEQRDLVEAIRVNADRLATRLGAAR
jgi:hypothetical protein